jgi:hypothetical protein
MTEKSLATKAGHLELLRGGKKDQRAERAAAALSGTSQTKKKWLLSTTITLLGTAGKAHMISQNLLNGFIVAMLLCCVAVHLCWTAYEQ